MAVILKALLRRAEQGPGTQRTLARTLAAGALTNHLPDDLAPALTSPHAQETPPIAAAADPPDDEPEHDADGAREGEEPLVGTVVPFGMFDPFEDETGAGR